MGTISLSVKLLSLTLKVTLYVPEVPVPGVQSKTRVEGSNVAPGGSPVAL